MKAKGQPTLLSDDTFFVLGKQVHVSMRNDTEQFSSSGGGGSSDSGRRRCRLRRSMVVVAA